MRRALLALALTGAVYAKFLDGIAIIVDNEPITTYEIEQTAQNLHIPKKEAIDLLIQKKLEAAQAKKLGISVSDFEVQNAIDDFARSKGMDIFSLREAIESKGLSWEEYKKSFKEQLLRKKLYQAIAKLQSKAPSEQQLKEYYQNHPQEFEVAKKVHIFKYISPSKEVLAKIAQNPLYQPQNPALLQKGEEVVDIQKVNPQFATLLSQIPEGHFGPILPLGDRYMLIYVAKKEGKEQIPFEEAKGYILKKLANTTRGKSVKEYFQKLKASANIKIVRLP